MTRLGVAALLVAASSSVASAGTYVGLGIGTAANGSASSDSIGMTDGVDRSGRLMVGFRLSRVSLEAQASRFDLVMGGLDFQSTQAGLGLKLSFPLGNNFELFGRGGVQRTWLSNDVRPMRDADGNGYFLGAGFEYRLNLGVTAASLFVDYQRSSTAFTNQNMVEYDGTTSMWTVGATVSL